MPEVIPTDRDDYPDEFPYNRFSDAIKRMKLSATLVSQSKIKALIEQGKDVIALTLGEPDFDTPRHIVEAAMEALDKGFTHYVPSPGIPELREAVADKAKRENNIPCDPGNVIISPAKMLIFHALAAVVNPGDKVLIPDPAWVSYEQMINFLGGRTVPVPCSASEDFRMTPEAVKDAMEGRTGVKAILLNSPSNPTGGVNLREDNEGIARIAKKHDLVVISDEIYEKIIYEGKHHSMASVEGMFDHTVTISGFSKAYAMTGWRLGWVIAPPVICKEMLKLQQHSITCATAFAQKGAVKALDGPQEPVEEFVEKFRKRRELMVRRLNEIDGLECAMPRGAFYAFPHYHFDMKTVGFSDFLLYKALVGVTPGDAFGQGGRHHVRLSYAASEERINEATDRIEDALSTLKRH